MLGKAFQMRGGCGMLSRKLDYLKVLLIVTPADLAVLAGGTDSWHHLGLLKQKGKVITPKNYRRRELRCQLSR